ncbi:MAG: phosphoenolpyruvate synthase [Proteobacteria bacterium]|nr:phosphoenolpyruvate synthase [Pseudomonadota bacterium]
MQITGSCFIDDLERSKKKEKEKIQFGTKAETLEKVAERITTALVLPQIRFTVDEWRSDPQQIKKVLLVKEWCNSSLIVRSSAYSEDSENASNAGHFTSVVNVRGEQAFAEAIEKVAQSFEDLSGRDQIFIQPMLTQVAMSGVAFTKDPNTNGEYLVINYDDKTQDTSSVTSGKTNELKTFYLFKKANIALTGPLGGVVNLCRELERLLGCDHLDIEFATTQDGDIVLLQVRPLILREESQITVQQHREALKRAYGKVANWFKPHPYLYGQRTAFGIMPDWNPAEIVGVRPRPLALSFYKDLVTDGVWAYQRHNYGYRNLRSFPLIQDFDGLPYIDVRVSFNSFIPATTEPQLADRLVNYYIDRLIESPNFHDKVEFEVIYSCYTLDFPKRLEQLRQYGFSKEDCCSFAEDLRTLTNGIINGKTGLWKKDREKVDVLEKRRQAILDSSLDTVSKIYWLLEDCKRYGTLPFAGLARAGFIAVQLMRSLVEIGVLTNKEYDAFMETLETVSSQMFEDLNNLNQQAFLEKYGHLRPGTYDILSPRYDEDPNRYFDWASLPKMGAKSDGSFSLSLQQFRLIEDLLKEHELEHDVLGLFDFIKGAIEGREYAKFVFTRSVSDALLLLKEFAGEHGFTAEDVSFAEVGCIAQLYDSCADAKIILAESIAKGKKKYETTKRLVLPPVITSPEDVWSFHMPELEPNFVTQRVASGNVSFPDSELEKIKKSILLIPSADPGFDWIFSHGIAGFITMYGGVNSHMAIRAGELGIPAVIGIGELEFNRLATKKLLEIDAANQQVRCLQ